MDLEDVKRVCAMFARWEGWQVYPQALNVWGTRCLVHVTHPQHGIYQISSERQAAALLARVTRDAPSQ